MTSRVSNQAQELQTCNDLLESELIKAGEQTEIMNALAQDVTRWQTRYEELEARGVENMFSRDSRSVVRPGADDETLLETHVQEQVAEALKGALNKLSHLQQEKDLSEREQRRLEKDVEQAIFDKDVLEKGLDEAMIELKRLSSIITSNASE